MIDLETLPEEHPMRNTPLAELHAEYRHCMQTGWTVIEPHGPGTYTFNNVTGKWAQFCKFRAPQGAKS